jgi:hypothetical protein
MRIFQATDCYPSPLVSGRGFTRACSRTNLFGAVTTSK